MAEPWFDPGVFVGLYGGLVGGLGGTALGVAGGYGGDLARKGQRRRWVGAVFVGVLALGIASLGLAVVAFSLGQPALIWGPPAGVGVLLSVAAFRVSRAVRQLYESAPKLILAERGATPDRRGR